MSQTYDYNKWNHSEAGRINRTKRIRFKDKRVYLSNIIRTGICSKCGKSVQKGEIKRTNLHHEKYDESDPSKHVIEICVGCHNKIHKIKKLNMTSQITGVT